MVAKIIKLDDYLNEYISMNQPNVIVGIVNALGVSEEIAHELYSNLTRQQEIDLVTTFMDEKLSDEQKIAVAHTIFDPITSTTEQSSVFDGIAIAEDFNYRCSILHEVGKNNFMDWLEENSIKYLIDNDGNFAIKCPDRKTHYRVGRHFEHVTNKWDRGSAGKNVDPIIKRNPLSVGDIKKPLNNAITEQGVSVPLRDPSQPWSIQNNPRVLNLYKNASTGLLNAVNDNESSMLYALTGMSALDPAYLKSEMRHARNKGYELVVIENPSGLKEAAQDSSMPLPDLSGTPPMFPARKGNDAPPAEMPDIYENSEMGALKVLGDLVNPSSEIVIDRLEEETTEWLVCDDASERSYVVNTKKGDFEEVKYICEAGGGSTYGHGHAPGRLSPRPEDPHGAKHDMPTTFDASGVEISYDPVMKKSVARFSDMIQHNDLEELVDATKREKIALMIQHKAYRASDFADPMVLKAALKKYDEVIGYMYDMKSKGGDPVIKTDEAKTKTAKQREKAARQKIADIGPVEKGGAGREAMATHGKNAGAHDTGKFSRKQKHKDAKLDESMMSSVLSMPSLGVKKLCDMAGLDASTISSVKEVVNGSENSIIQSGTEISDLGAAMDHLGEVFNIYKKLGDSDRSELRHNLINTVMGEGKFLGESIMGLLLDNKPEVLMEFNIGNVNIFTPKERVLLLDTISNIKNAIYEDVGVLSGILDITPLARVGFLLELLHSKLENE